MNYIFSPVSLVVAIVSLLTLLQNKLSIDLLYSKQLNNNKNVWLMFVKKNNLCLGYKN